MPQCASRVGSPIQREELCVRPTLLFSSHGVRLVSLLLGIGLVDCGFDVKHDAKDAIHDVKNDIPDPGDVNLDVKVCGDLTLNDLLHGDSISDDCRNKVESFLPEPQSSFESRLVVLGQSKDATGARTLYVIGADAGGHALFTTVPSEVSVSVSAHGKASVVASADLKVDLPNADDLLSLSLVNDYSASMREADLEVVSEIESDVFKVMPPIYEGEVREFSDDVTITQAFTTSKKDLLASVAIDMTYTRGATALYDGMGDALQGLVMRERPLHVLLVSTDGQENASKMYDQAGLISTIADHDVIVIMLGALFADVKTLKALAGEHGVFVYARGYGRLKTAVQGLTDALTHIAAVRLPASAKDADQATLEIAGQKVTLPLSP
jgi:hypothetical protein